MVRTRALRGVSSCTLGQGAGGQGVGGQGVGAVAWPG